MAFHARNAEILSDDDVRFSEVETNHGNGYDSDTGHFTAPVSGIYAFNTFFVMSSTTDLYLSIQVNGATVCTGYAMDNYDMGVCSADVQLDQGDVVHVEMTSSSGSLYSYAYGSGFSGFLYLPL